MRITHHLLITALLASTGHAVAASSVDLNVKGSITPSACTPSMPSSGTVDYGKLSAKSLNADKVTRLPPEYLQLRVECDAATLYALQGHDNRAGSAPNDEGGFGLGLINGDEKLGSLCCGSRRCAFQVYFFPRWRRDLGALRRRQPVRRWHNRRIQQLILHTAGDEGPDRRDENPLADRTHQ
jgi:hypothetical protein